MAPPRRESLPVTPPSTASIAVAPNEHAKRRRSVSSAGGSSEGEGQGPESQKESPTKRSKEDNYKPGEVTNFGFIIPPMKQWTKEEIRASRRAYNLRWFGHEETPGPDHERWKCDWDPDTGECYYAPNVTGHSRLKTMREQGLID